MITDGHHDYVTVKPSWITVHKDMILLTRGAKIRRCTLPENPPP